MALEWYKDTEYTVVCSHCGDTESIYASDGEYKATDTPSKYFVRQGWRGLNGETLCPECVEAAQREEGQDAQSAPSAAHDITTL